ncbi:MAG: cell division ATP-binding protein FtsE [Coriobacteriia bacterium]|nr:cell division ATP-binding protein FtsE [Coriobacteriia bacterium]
MADINDFDLDFGAVTPNAPPSVPPGVSGAPHDPEMDEIARGYAELAAPVVEAPRVAGPKMISVRHLTKRYSSEKAALEDVSVDIDAGEFVFIVGHSGSGKSTFIRALLREVIPTSGQIVVAGHDLDKLRNSKIPYLRRNIGCVFQDFKLLPNKTAFENVAFALQVIGKSKHVINTQVPEVLRLVGLEEKINNYPSQLSGGEQQRVSIARAFVNRPPLLLCDEPTGNLDPQTSLGIMKLLDRINKTGTTILIATHDREMVNSMRRRVIALEGGHIARDQARGVYGYVD